MDALSDPLLGASTKRRCDWRVGSIALTLVGALAFAVGRHSAVSPIAPPLVGMEAPIPIRTVVLTFFEPELDPWRALGGDSLPFAASEFPELLLLRELGAVVMCTGMGPRKASAAVMALGLDSRFDTRSAVWLASGVAGVDPERTTVGSAVWADEVVDGAASYYVDAAEENFPSDWSTGWIPLTCGRPFCTDHGPAAEARKDGVRYSLDRSLVTWAHGLTEGVTLPSVAEYEDMWAPFAAAGFAAAAGPPRVLRGGTLSTATVWVGYKHTSWAREWVRFWTAGAAPFVTTAMEDSAVATGLHMLARAGRANSSRLLVLRTGANFCTQPPGVPIHTFVAGFVASDTHLMRDGTPTEDSYWRPGFDPVTLAAADAAFRVSSVVVRAIAREPTLEAAVRG